MSLLAAAEALFVCGRFDEAAARAATLVEFSIQTNQPGAEAWGRMVLASSHQALGRSTDAATNARTAKSMAEQRDMAPLAARAGLVLAMATGATELPAAARACEAAGVGAWVARMMP